LPDASMSAGRIIHAKKTKDGRNRKAPAVP
jgi:hypothetical protein